ncbi:hypothetical protein [Lacinutrix algicola]|uniref:hypothetical protein n=1 Tax=Lacinutrix algicola TaxID=342954 RepID=UPI0006E1270D|nr:hypothetical protein [Lacinutrix algicola]
MELENLDMETLSDMYLGLSDNLELKIALEAELQSRIGNNTRYSREHLVQNSFMNRGALGIHFIPTTDSYNNYGYNITVTVSENEELEGLVQNALSTPQINTYGNIRLRNLVQGNLTQEQVDALENEGIDISHISHII